MNERDLTLDKIGQLLAMLPRQCSHFDDYPPCPMCFAVCPIDVAMSALARYRDEITRKAKESQEKPVLPGFDVQT